MGVILFLAGFVATLAILVVLREVGFWLMAKVWAALDDERPAPKWEQQPAGKAAVQDPR
jgi:hypothetical protein